mmetsp:Transcript_23267/g.66149  ORF Transcript_23267/g.66149 Transcript_23267/m.66149 type:complete len:135 (-) Transcript_23267:107-511(-)
MPRHQCGRHICGSDSWKDTMSCIFKWSPVVGGSWGGPSRLTATPDAEEQRRGSALSDTGHGEAVPGPDAEPMSPTAVELSAKDECLDEEDATPGNPGCASDVAQIDAESAVCVWMYFYLSVSVFAVLGPHAGSP